MPRNAFVRLAEKYRLASWDGGTTTRMSQAGVLGGRRGAADKWKIITRCHRAPCNQVGNDEAKAASVRMERVCLRFGANLIDFLLSERGRTRGRFMFSTSHPPATRGGFAQAGISLLDSPDGENQLVKEALANTANLQNRIRKKPEELRSRPPRRTPIWTEFMWAERRRQGLNSLGSFLRRAYFAPAVRLSDGGGRPKRQAARPWSGAAAPSE